MIMQPLQITTFPFCFAFPESVREILIRNSVTEREGERDRQTDRDRGIERHRERQRHGAAEIEKGENWIKRLFLFFNNWLNCFYF